VEVVHPSGNADGQCRLQRGVADDLAGTRVEQRSEAAARSVPEWNAGTFARGAYLEREARRVSARSERGTARIGSIAGSLASSLP
jgi:hypothetical protein